MACAVALLAGSGELIQSFWYLMHVDTGLDTSHVLTMRVDLPNVRYNSPESVAAFYDRAMNRIRSVPGVQNAAAINMLPVAQSGRNIPPGDYFATMGIPIRGRNFLPEEMSGKERAVIINQTMARSLWRDKDPIGYRLRGFGDSDEWFTVVGVSRDVHQAGLNQPVESELFAPLRTSDESLTTQYVVVRSRTDARELAATLRHEISLADPEAAVYNFRSMDDVLYDSVAVYRITATLLVLFAVIALLLAGFGLYGVVSYSVTERKREFAIRMALGAQPVTLIGMIFQQSMVTTAVGAMLGVGGAFYLSHLLTDLLYGINGTNAPALAMAIVLLASIASIATLASVMRVVRLDPMLPLNALVILSSNKTVRQHTYG
jgi:putative ABC transport system permease protein